MAPSTKKLVYTRDSGRLTFEQRCFYESNGYLVMPRLVPTEILANCSKRFDDIVDGTVKRGRMTVMHDISDRKAVNKIQDISFDDVFSEYIEYKPMLDVVEAVTGPNIMAVHSMLIAKPPDSGSNSSKHPPHQDLYYFPFRPADRIVASWTAIELCDTLNGCLFVYHIYHKNYILTSILLDLLNLSERQDLVMQPCDTVFFHPLLVHGSGVNRSNRTRKAISCHYAAEECNYIDITGSLHENVAKEIFEVNKKRNAAYSMTYADVFRLKSNLVRGMRSNL